MLAGIRALLRRALTDLLSSAVARKGRATVFSYRVEDPERYGVVELGEGGRAFSLEEKPLKPKSHYAVTGLYFYDNRVVQFAHDLKPSLRGELEITDLNRIYMDAGDLFIEQMGGGYAWLDTGTHESLLEASELVRTIQNRQGIQVACLEESPSSKALSRSSKPVRPANGSSRPRMAAQF